jgi:hypothetical protein
MPAPPPTPPTPPPPREPRGTHLDPPVCSLLWCVPIVVFFCCCCVVGVPLGLCCRRRRREKEGGSAHRSVARSSTSKHVVEPETPGPQAKFRRDFLVSTDVKEAAPLSEDPSEDSVRASRVAQDSVRVSICHRGSCAQPAAPSEPPPMLAALQRSSLNVLAAALPTRRCSSTIRRLSSSAASRYGELSEEEVAAEAPHRVGS